MPVAASLIPELERAVGHGSAEKRAATLRRITTLFLDGASQFTDEHVKLFDDVMGYLIEEIESQAIAELARRIAPVPNAPPEVVRTLAHSDDIAIAGPVLEQSQLDQYDLLRIAGTQSQPHLLAIAMRPDVNEALAEVLLARGDQSVVRSVAANQQAQLSDNAFASLVTRARQDGELAEKVGLRTDIPPRLFRQLLIQATEVVQQRLLARAKPETASEIRKVLALVSDQVGAKAATRSYADAMTVVRIRHDERALGEEDVVEYADAGKYEETIAALATICGVPVEVVDRLMGGDRYDPVLILARSAGFSWDTTRAIITTVPGAKGTSTQAIEAARENYERLTTPTAQRVVRFWQVRQEISGPLES